MINKEQRHLIYIVLGMVIFAVLFGLVCRITVLAASDPATSTEEVTTEDHLSDEELEHILKVSQQWLDNNPVPELKGIVTASDTDADYDTAPYLTYGLDQEWIDDSTSLSSALNDIYRMVLSIRNILLVFTCIFVIYFFDKKLHSILYKLFGGGR